MNARYGEPGAETFSVCAQLPPISAGMSTLCPRLETGNSSVTPWTSPVTTAWTYVRWYDIGRAAPSVVSGFQSFNSNGPCRHPRPRLTEVWPAGNPTRLVERSGRRCRTCGSLIRKDERNHGAAARQDQNRLISNGPG